jgi:hypothetical protein
LILPERDGCSAVIRYVAGKNIYERLIKSTKGLILFGIALSNNLIINVLKCTGTSNDEAPNMQNQCNRFGSWSMKVFVDD